MRQNLAIYDFELSAEDMEILGQLKHEQAAKKFMHIDFNSFA